MNVSNGRFSSRSGTSSDCGLVSNRVLKQWSGNCANLLTKVRVLAANPQQSVASGLKPLPTHSRSGRRIDNWRRLGQRLQDPEWRRYGYLLLLSKFVAIVVLAFVAIPIVAHFVGSPVLAADPVIKANDIVNPINTLWTLLAAFLVFGMQAGFTMLEAGFSRSRETVNVLMECIVDTCLCGILFYAIGFAFMVPVHGFCGIWGTLSLGLFATGEFGATGPFAPDTSAPLLVKGLLYGGGIQVLTAQFVGSAIVTLSAFSLGMALMAAVNLTGTLRVSQEGELEGIDVHEHGMPAYPEYAIQATPSAHSSLYEVDRTKPSVGQPE